MGVDFFFRFFLGGGCVDMILSLLGLSVLECSKGF